MRRLVQRIRCWLGLHEWGPWKRGKDTISLCINIISTTTGEVRPEIAHDEIPKSWRECKIYGKREVAVYYEEDPCER